MSYPRRSKEMGFSETRNIHELVLSEDSGVLKKVLKSFKMTFEILSTSKKIEFVSNLVSDEGRRLFSFFSDVYEFLKCLQHLQRAIQA